jgi:hypothetical protein
MFRLFQRAALHGLTSESSAQVAESEKLVAGIARERAAAFKNARRRGTWPPPRTK